MPEDLKNFINNLFNPITFTLLGILLFALMLAFYRVWTKPRIALAIAGLMVLFFVMSFTDANFRKIATKEDNIPIVSLIFILYFFMWLFLRQCAVNDERIEKGMLPLEAEEKHERILVWPDLVFSEFLCAIIFTAILVIWSIYIKAPLEEPSNPMKTPNPSKAPWYFLGLQEMLVYFDPWLAGVVLPTMIITGLMCIPYCDRNPKGCGYYTLKERPVVIVTFLFGFIVLWILLIIMGTALRGPNWNFYGPFEPWDPHKLQTLNNIDLSEYFWVRWLGVGKPDGILMRELPGFVLIGLFFAIGPALLAKTVFKKLLKEMGFIRFSLIVIHFLVMFSMLIKMVLRWTLNLKYIVAIPEYFFNI